MEGSWVTRAPSTPSGGLCMGKGQRKSRVRPKPPFLSPASLGSTPEAPRRSRAAPGSGPESSGSGEDGAGQVLAGHGWAKQLRQLCPLKSGPQPWGQGSGVSASYGYTWSIPLRCEHGPPRAARPGRAYPRSALTQSSFSAQQLQKERRKSLSARCSPACGQRRAPTRPCPVGTATGAGRSPVGQDRGAAQPCRGPGTETHRKVTTQKPQGQTRTRDLVGSPSSSPAASLAAPFLLVSTCSWPRARQSCGRGALPRLQSGAAGSELEVAEPGGSPPASP